MAYETMVGDTTSSRYRSDHQRLTSKDLYEAQVRWAIFSKITFLKALGVESFGVEAMKGFSSFVPASTKAGGMIRYDDGVYAVSGMVNATEGTSYHTGRLGSHQGQILQGGDEWSYSWHEINANRQIPVKDIQDNGKGMIKIQAMREDEMKQSYIQDFNGSLLGNSTYAPSDYTTMGPTSVFTDLPNLISVSQTRTVGGIAKTNSYWQNGTKAITSIGGGGEMDRPLVLRRKMEKGIVVAARNAEATLDYLLLATEGAWLYYGRLMYADSVQSGSFTVNDRYDAAGVLNYAFMKQPMIYDRAVTVPFGATASTEAIYAIHKPSLALSLRKEENFKFSGWEDPRVHDQYKTIAAMLQTRYTFVVPQMRPHTVFYNLPANSD